MKADYDKVMALMKTNNAKIKALQKEREEPPSNVALSLYDMIYMAKCYPGKINPGVWQDGLQPISALRLGTAERSQAYNMCDTVNQTLEPFGTRCYTIFALCPAMTIFPFTNAPADKMSGYFHV